MVTLSNCISEYTYSFGRKVFGKILFLPCLEVGAACPLKAALEVEVTRRFKRAEFGVQRNSKL